MLKHQSENENVTKLQRRVDGEKWWENFAQNAPMLQQDGDVGVTSLAQVGTGGFVIAHDAHIK